MSIPESEVQRLLTTLHRDYVHTAYHVERYLLARQQSEEHTIQQELLDTVLHLNSMRANMNQLFDLLQPGTK